MFAGNEARAQAKIILDELLSADPKNVPALVLRGRLESLGRIGGSEAAKTYFARALAADPLDADANYEHALALNDSFGTSKEDRAQSLVELKKAVSLGRTDATARHGLADALNIARDYEGSAKQLDLILKTEPKNLEALTKRAVLRDRQKDWPRSLADWSRVVLLKPEGGGYSSRGNAHVENKQYAEAIAVDPPKNAGYYFKRGNAGYMRGRHDAAIADYTKALELDPKLKAAEDNREVAKRVKAKG